MNEVPFENRFQTNHIIKFTVLCRSKNMVNKSKTMVYGRCDNLVYIYELRIKWHKSKRKMVPMFPLNMTELSILQHSHPLANPNYNSRHLWVGWIAFNKHRRMVRLRKKNVENISKNSTKNDGVTLKIPLIIWYISCKGKMATFAPKSAQQNWRRLKVDPSYTAI